MKEIFDDFIDNVFDWHCINELHISPSEILKKTRPEYYKDLYQTWLNSVGECIQAANQQNDKVTKIDKKRSAK